MLVRKLQILEVKVLVEDLILRSKSTETIDCIFMETKDGWRLSAESSFLTHPLSQKVLHLPFVTSEFSELSDEELISTTQTFKSVVDFLLSEDFANDQTGFNIINANEVCNFFVCSTFYLEGLIEIKSRNIEFNLVEAQKIYLNMLSACMNTINLISLMQEWAEVKDSSIHIDLFNDFIIFLESGKDLIPVLLNFQQTETHAKKADEIMELLRYQPYDFNKLQEEMILLFDYERELKNTQHQERIFSLHFIHLIFHTLIGDSE